MSTFHDVDSAIKQLEKSGAALLEVDAAAVQRIRKLADFLIQVTTENPDGALATLHLFKREAQPVELAVYHAILCAVAASYQDTEAEALHSLVCAALTANIAFWKLQERLNRHSGPISEELREAIRQHPMKSVTLLEENGVQDPLWLRIVAQHHERADGSGYPAGRSGDQVEPHALLLHLAESYCASITARGYRKAMKQKDYQHGTEALHKLHKMSKRVAPQLLPVLIKSVGVYPPGTWVQLVNKEIAIVVLREEDSTKPRVASFCKPEVPPFAYPIVRDTSEEKYLVAGIAEPPRRRTRIHMSTLWEN